MKSVQKFELGPLQKLWLKQLRKYPERQMKNALGQGTPKNYKACCLGELHLCAFRLQKKALPFNKGGVITVVESGSISTLTGVHENYGLRDSTGNADRDFKTSLGPYRSLAVVNDTGISWTEIADIIEKDPINFFNKSV